ncbi:MAG TPA: helix-turn-helix domain-containing protein [Solirubrobacteraceae bacterium]
MSSTPRERILDEAMRLFGKRGYSATSIAKIEAVSGLTPGAGGLYHHFKSKEAILAAGIERQLSRLDIARRSRYPNLDRRRDAGRYLGPNDVHRSRASTHE